MSWLILNLIFGIFATALILGILSAGMRLEYGKRSQRAAVAVIETNDLRGGQDRQAA